jgi:hypothetical protein
MGMIVLIKRYGDKLYDVMNECDRIHRRDEADAFNLLLYKEGKLIEDYTFTEKTRVFIMEAGKTIDRIDFKVNDK